MDSYQDKGSHVAAAAFPLRTGAPPRPAFFFYTVVPPRPPRPNMGVAPSLFFGKSIFMLAVALLSIPVSGDTNASAAALKKSTEKALISLLKLRRQG